MSSSHSATSPQTTATTTSVDRRVGIEGTGNLTQGEGSQFTDRSTDNKGGIQTTAPVSTNQQSFSDNGDVFAPTLSFTGNTWLTSANVGKALSQNPSVRSDLAAMLAGSGDSRTPEQWLLADLQAGDTNSQFISMVKSAGGDIGGGGSSGAGNFGGASDKGGVVAGGSVSAPIASGSDSVAQQTGNGGVAINGDNSGLVVSAPVGGAIVAPAGDINGPVISAPISAPTSFGNNSPVIVIAPPRNENLVGDPVDRGDGGGFVSPIATGENSVAIANNGGASSGRDLSIGGNVISNNSGGVTITDVSADVAQAAIESGRQLASAAIAASSDNLNASFGEFDKALAQVANSVKDPNERVAADTLKTIGYIAGALALFGVVAVFARKSR